ncbi:DUF899 family protein [Bacillus sp. UMB0893]|uniref:DUF899 family protein n=1 Tax=Bacillus sp. UMB0893 TaxID=2066053 RepID=UPI000C78F7D1|nr:DUF899 family protein [Bacillus sp. UMB0893]PLR67761.1 hypothetical protein CYJ36_10560 [Bacillus sp. UMB0893]
MNQNELMDEIQILEKELLEKKKRLTDLRKLVPNKMAENYQFIASNGHSVTLLQLFKEKDELIVVHNMGKSCSYCTMWADCFNGVYHHISKKAAFVLSTPDEPHVQDAFAAQRGWKFPIISTAGTSFKQDFGYEKNGYYYPGVSTFRKDDKGSIYHCAHAPFGPGDDFCSVWPLFDLLPSGSESYRPSKMINENTPFQMTNNVAFAVQNYEKAIDFYKNLLGMTLESSNEFETKFSMNGTFFYIENKKHAGVFFEFAAEDFSNSMTKLLNAGCEVSEKLSSTSVMLKDPFGLRFHLFESVK